jgi:hypothetical protein
MNNKIYIIEFESGALDVEAWYDGEYKGLWQHPDASKLEIRVMAIQDEFGVADEIIRMKDEDVVKAPSKEDDRCPVCNGFGHWMPRFPDNADELSDDELGEYYIFECYDCGQVI